MQECSKDVDYALQECSKDVDFKIWRKSIQPRQYILAWKVFHVIFAT